MSKPKKLMVAFQNKYCVLLIDPEKQEVHSKWLPYEITGMALRQAIIDDVEILHE